jgi:hypothetical protein
MFPGPKGAKTKASYFVHLLYDSSRQLRKKNF